MIEVPGITADLACAAALGSPLGDYNAVISPGEHAPWEVIARQVRAVAEADFVITFCPSPGPLRDRQLGAVLAILRQSRPADTPVAVVQDAQHASQQIRLCTLGDADQPEAGRPGVVIIGSSRTRVVAGRLVTPGHSAISSPR